MRKELPVHAGVLLKTWATPRNALKNAGPFPEFTLSRRIRVFRARYGTAEVEATLVEELADALFKRGYLLWQAGDPHGAEMDFNEAYSLYGGSRALFNRGVCRLERKNLAEAYGDFEVFVATEPQDPEGYYGQGVALMKLDRYSEAGERFDRALRLDQSRGEVYLSRAAVNYHLSRYRNALEDCELALQELAVMLYNLKTCNQRDIEILSYRNAAYYNRALCWKQLGNWRAAIEELNQIAPNSSRAVVMSRSEIYFATGDWGRAISDIHKVFRLTWQDVALLPLGALYHSKLALNRLIQHLV